VDENTNEYAEIGRDRFLFDRGATQELALGNYFGLGPTLEAAERALRDDRRLQVEAIVRF
jgi:hypothetical protein